MTFVDPEQRLTVDLRLYAIVDPETAGGHALPDLARMVAAGGATVVQLRDKVHDTAEMIALARAIKAALPADVPLIVNDSVDVAREAGADGVHLGQEDMSVVAARDLLGPVPFIGLSIKTVEQARAAPLGILDYVGIGGVYGTTSKQNVSRPIGPEGLARIVVADFDTVPTNRPDAGAERLRRCLLRREASGERQRAARVPLPFVRREHPL